MHVQLNVAALLDAAGQVVRIAAALTGITTGKRAEAASAERARPLDLSNDAIAVRNVNDRIIFWNHGAADLYGCWVSMHRF